MPETGPARSTRLTAHVLLDALSAFEGGRFLGRQPGRGPMAGLGPGAELDSDPVIATALARLGEVGAVGLATDPRTGHQVVDVRPVLQAALTLLTSMATMLREENPELDELTVITRLRAAVDAVALH